MTTNSRRKANDDIPVSQDSIHVFCFLWRLLSAQLAKQDASQFHTHFTLQSTLSTWHSYCIVVALNSVTTTSPVFCLHQERGIPPR
jgi:hypothetical protein